MNNNFESLSVDKYELLRRLAYDENIAKCLLCNEPNFLDYELDEEEMDSIPFNYVFPSDFTLGTQNEVKSYITMRFRYRKSKSGNAIKVGQIAFRIFCHHSIIRTDYGKLRYDFLLEQVHRLIGDTRGIGWIGKLDWVGMEDTTVDSEKKYVGLDVVYQATEFM